METKVLQVALVEPPISGHKYRGTGVYTDNLYKHLKKIPELRIDFVDYGSDLANFDVIHFPYFDPFFLTLPLFKKKHTVVTVHDLIPMKFPNFFKRGIKGEIKWNIQRISLRGAKTVITDSKASKDDIVKFTGIDSNKIHVIYLGVGKHFKVIDDKDKLTSIQKKYNLPESFILDVGDVNYNKNIPGLVNAFSEVIKSNTKTYLVLIGNGFVDKSKELNEILSLIKKLDLERKILRFKYIPIEDLVGIYNLATVYVQVSLAEGFGLPVLEAMSCGCPVVVSNTYSLKEIVGNSGILVAPQDISKIAINVIELLLNESKQQYAAKKGRERAEMFSWDKCARETYAVYKQVI